MASKQKIYLVHWKAEEAEKKAVLLAGEGFKVEYGGVDASRLRMLKTTPPEAVVIDLDRLPSQGRDVAIAVRMSKTSRHVPLLFVGGVTAKVEKIKKILPDAVYSDWDRIASAINLAIASPLKNPVVPTSVMAGYSGAPLPKKLGIKANSMVVLVGAPEGFENTLGTLPAGVVLRNRGRRDLTLWFTKSRKKLLRRLDRMKIHSKGGGLWIIWPKKASGVKTDLTQVVVRKEGMAAGMVDFKICAIDQTWSGLRFTLRENSEETE